jgi:2-polyprenyl-6-methoxyphenol hydroxylase-like FAD-dependent oxidoreductase
MAEILVLGAGLTGLTTAMLLARDGHDVTVLERDPADPPPDAAAAWTGWDRDGVAQFHQLHLMLPRWREVMESELPAVLDALRAAGGADGNTLHHRPPAQTGGWQAGDERYAVVTGRRPVVEAAVATVAAGCPGLRVRRGVAVTGLLTAGAGAVPRVVGVRTDTTASRDHALRDLRHVPAWEAAARLYPATAGWIDAEPITGISVMAGIEDRRRRFVIDSVPVVTGLVAVGDAWACTNPSLGRGASIGAMHACVLRDVVAKEGTSDPETLVLRFAAETDATVTPYLDSTLSFDRHRLAEMEADVAGVPYEPGDPAWAMTRALAAGSPEDPVVARALAAIASVLALPGEVLSDPAVRGRVAGFLGRPHYAPGADRSELLAAVRGAERSR